MKQTINAEVVNEPIRKQNSNITQVNKPEPITNDQEDLDVPDADEFEEGEFDELDDYEEEDDDDDDEEEEDEDDYTATGL